jgi:hypothetical protein
MSYGDAGRGLGVNPNALRYASPTGTVLMRWDGAGKPTIWTVDRPATTHTDARLELARRYLHVFGVGTASAFAQWAGVSGSHARTTFDRLRPELAPAGTPTGDAWILAAKEPRFAEPSPAPAPARLLPSGDTYFLLQGADRELLVPDAHERAELWTPRVWPGALLVSGQVAGTWRRSGAQVTISAWRSLNPAERAAVEAEAESLPLPDLASDDIRVAWGD